MRDTNRKDATMPTQLANTREIHQITPQEAVELQESTKRATDQHGRLSFLREFLEAQGYTWSHGGKNTYMTHPNNTQRYMFKTQAVLRQAQSKTAGWTTLTGYEPVTRKKMVETVEAFLAKRAAEGEMMAEHTSIPWRNLEPDDGTIRVDNTIVCLMFDPSSKRPRFAKSKANAELIVQACNAHDALVEACERAAEDFARFRPHDNGTIQQLRAALAKAKP